MGVLLALLLALGLMSVAYFCQKTRIRYEAPDAQLAPLIRAGRQTEGYAHDLNNLLTAIGGNAALVEVLCSDQKCQQAAASIQELCECSARITRQMLDALNANDPERERLDLARAVAEIRPVLENLLSLPGALMLHVEDAPLHVELPRSQLDQLLINLVVNSREASASLVQVHVYGAAASSEAEATDATKMLAVIEVADNGTGIVDAGRDDNLERYRSTKAEAGRGIGLVTVNRIAAEAGGDFRLRNRDDGGALARVRLPLAA